MNIKDENKYERYVKSLRPKYEKMYSDLDLAINDLANGKDRIEVQNELERVLEQIRRLDKLDLEWVLR